MKKEEAINLKPGDHILTIGLKDVIECIVETVSEYGSVNVHNINNKGHYFRTYDEIFHILDSNESIEIMFYKQAFDQIKQLYNNVINDAFSTLKELLKDDDSIENLKLDYYKKSYKIAGEKYDTILNILYPQGGKPINTKKLKDFIIQKI